MIISTYPIYQTLTSVTSLIGTAIYLIPIHLVPASLETRITIGLILTISTLFFQIFFQIKVSTKFIDVIHGVNWNGSCQNVGAKCVWTE